MGAGRIILGTAIGIGAVAALPFTGGGSVLGAATLASSLSGVGTGILATAAGFVGAALADGLGDEADNAAYADGYADAKNEYIIPDVPKTDMDAMANIEDEWGPAI